LGYKIKVTLRGFVDVLVSFWGQRSRSQQADNTISHKPMKAISLYFRHRCIWIRGYADYILGSTSQCSKVKVTV